VRSCGFCNQYHVTIFRLNQYLPIVFFPSWGYEYILFVVTSCDWSGHAADLTQSLRSSFEVTRAWNVSLHPYRVGRRSLCNRSENFTVSLKTNVTFAPQLYCKLPCQTMCNSGAGLEMKHRAGGCLHCTLVSCNEKYRCYEFSCKCVPCWIYCVFSKRGLLKVKIPPTFRLCFHAAIVVLEWIYGLVVSILVISVIFIAYILKYGYNSGWGAVSCTVTIRVLISQSV
jgi:hypothetical protein